MPKKRTTTPETTNRTHSKLTPSELKVTQALRCVIKNKTSTHALNRFMYRLNDMVRTALIAECLERLEKSEITSQ